MAITAVLAILGGGMLGISPAASQTPDASNTPDAVSPSPGRVIYADDPRAVPGAYIVSLGENTDPDMVDVIAEELTARYGGSKQFSYTAALAGFSVAATADEAALIAGDPRVEYVAQDIEVDTDALGVQPNPPSWGLDRIDQRSLPLDLKYHYPNLGNSVVAYVIDTGIL